MKALPFIAGMLLLTASLVLSSRAAAAVSADGSNSSSVTTDHRATSSLKTVCATAVVVGLEWSPVRSAASYSISRNGTKIAITALTTYSDQTVSPTTGYTYSMVALGSRMNILSTQSLSVTTAKASANGDAPYCPSSLISGMTWHWSTAFNQQNGSDLWPVTWGADGNIYAFFGDGGGFFGTDSLGRVSFGIAKITGPTPTINSNNASNVYGGYKAAHPATIRGKVGGIIAVDSNFYALGGIWQPGEGGPWDEPNHYEIVSSTGNAYSWVDNYSNWIFCGSGTDPNGFCPIRFLNFGAGNTGAIDGYVYLYGTTERAFFGSGSPDPVHTYMARVPKNQILTKASYQVYAGADGSGNPIWNADWTKMQPIFTDPGPRPIAISEAVYNPVLKRFIAVAQGYVNQAAFYDSPHPWGPWTSIGYYNSNPDNTGGWGNLGSSSFKTGHGDGLGLHFINAWTSSDGITMWAAFSSDGIAGSGADLTSLAGKSMDSFSLVSVTLSLAPTR